MCITGQTVEAHPEQVGDGLAAEHALGLGSGRPHEALDLGGIVTPSAQPLHVCHRQSRILQQQSLHASTGLWLFGLLALYGLARVSSHQQ